MPMPAALTPGTAPAIPLPSLAQLPAASLPHAGSGPAMPSASASSGALSNAVQLPGAASMPNLGGGAKSLQPHTGPNGGPSGSDRGFSSSAPGVLSIPTHEFGSGPATGPVPQEMGKGKNGRKSGPDGDNGPTPVKAGGRHGSNDAPLGVMPSTGPSGTPGDRGAKHSSSGDKPVNFDAKPGDTTPASTKDPDFSEYMADLQRRIKRAWFPVKEHETRKVKVMFKVHTNGELSNLRISQSSGFALSDQAALQAVNTAAPFKHLPQNAPENVDIEFTFDYNVFSGRQF